MPASIKLLLSWQTLKTPTMATIPTGSPVRQARVGVEKCPIRLPFTNRTRIAIFPETRRAFHATPNLEMRTATVNDSTKSARALSAAHSPLLVTSLA